MEKEKKLGMITTDSDFGPNEIEIIYDEDVSPFQDGISTDALNNARKVVDNNLGITPPKMKEEEATEGIKEKVTQTTTPTAEVDPYAKTKAAQAAAQKAFSEQLAGMFKEREKAREKRKRTAEKVAIGHALGDLFGAIGAHYAATKNNTGAVVAQPISPKSYEKVQALIDEGVADKNTFDQYMLSLTQKKGEQDIAMANAEDKLAIDQAAAALKAKRENDLLDKKHQNAIKLQELVNEGKQAERKFDAEQKELDRQSREKSARIKAYGQAHKKDLGLEDWQLGIASYFIPEEDTITKTTETELGTQTETTNKPHNVTKEDFVRGYNEAKKLMKKWGLPNTADGAQKFEELYDLIGKKAKSGKEVTVDLIEEALNKGVSIEDIKNYLK